jgi:hypothetical protein
MNETEKELTPDSETNKKDSDFDSKGVDIFANMPDATQPESVKKPESKEKPKPKPDSDGSNIFKKIGERIRSIITDDTIDQPE